MAVDSNLLLLLVIGLADRGRIAAFERTSRYTSEDYDTLAQFLSGFDRIVTTPNVLTEVFNLLGWAKGQFRSSCYDALLLAARKLREIYVASHEVLRDPELLRFGFTDCSFVPIAQQRFLVLSHDYALCGRLQTLGLSALNFESLRPLGRRHP